MPEIKRIMPTPITRNVGHATPELGIGVLPVVEDDPPGGVGVLVTEVIDIAFAHADDALKFPLVSLTSQDTSNDPVVAYVWKMLQSSSSASADPSPKRKRHCVTKDAGLPLQTKRMESPAGLVVPPGMSRLEQDRPDGAPVGEGVGDPAAPVPVGAGVVPPVPPVTV